MKNKLPWVIVLVLAIIALGTYCFYNRNVIVGKKMDTVKLEERVNNYITRIDPNLTIDDVFVYSDSDYYFSIKESNTNRGAMELLVNPYTGAIRPEQGPNMMWNEKYGMMSGRYGMMGGYYDNDYSQLTPISKEDALSKANDYVKNHLDENETVSGEGHEFYGYYTFHIMNNGNTAGMLSVNEYTGEVWFHNWHGHLIQVISLDQ